MGRLGSISSTALIWKFMSHPFSQRSSAWFVVHRKERGGSSEDDPLHVRRLVSGERLDLVAHVIHPLRMVDAEPAAKPERRSRGPTRPHLWNPRPADLAASRRRTWPKAACPVPAPRLTIQKQQAIDLMEVGPPPPAATSASRICSRGCPPRTGSAPRAGPSGRRPCGRPCAPTRSASWRRSRPWRPRPADAEARAPAG